MNKTHISRRSFLKGLTAALGAVVLNIFPEIGYVDTVLAGVIKICSLGGVTYCCDITGTGDTCWTNFGCPDGYEFNTEYIVTCSRYASQCSWYQCKCSHPSTGPYQAYCLTTCYRPVYCWMCDAYSCN